jgi:hypothetical protein
MRICHCGRPLEDERFHDAQVVGPPLPPIVGWHRGRRVRGDEPVGRGRVLYTCRMRLIAESPITGKRLVPKDPQRFTDPGILYSRNARFVHEDLLKEA